MESSFAVISSLDARTTIVNNGETPRSSSLPLLNTHRRYIREQMQHLIDEQDRFQTVLKEQFDSPQTYPFFKRIDEWEKESIEKIQKRAQQLREQLTEIVVVHIRRLSNKLQESTNRLLNQKTLDTFVENDLEHWGKKFDKLKANFTSPSTITINECTLNPLVRDTYIALTVTNELFLQSGAYNQIVTHDSSSDSIDIRGQNEYDKGCHRIRLRMEQTTHESTFLGICSESSSYGWSSNQFIHVNGSIIPTVLTEPIEMQKDDIISLILDCDRSWIMMINERSKIAHELSVNHDVCALPWQLHIVLNEPNSRIKILRE